MGLGPDVERVGIFTMADATRMKAQQCTYWVAAEAVLEKACYCQIHSASVPDLLPAVVVDNLASHGEVDA